ncbi:MAG: hypothetical protein Q9162_005358 [Coniocarpon cinnabarinum]
MIDVSEKGVFITKHNDIIPTSLANFVYNQDTLKRMIMGLIGLVKVIIKEFGQKTPSPPASQDEDPAQGSSTNPHDGGEAPYEGLGKHNGTSIKCHNQKTPDDKSIQVEVDLGEGVNEGEAKAKAKGEKTVAGTSKAVSTWPRQPVRKLLETHRAATLTPKQYFITTMTPVRKSSGEELS